MNPSVFKQLPKEYSFLSKLEVLPRTIQEALSLYGTHEVPGKGNNPLIMEWVTELNRAGVEIEGYTNDDIPWCGLLTAIVVLCAGKVPVQEPLWALNWASYGVPAKAASLGDVLVFKRPKGGHVGFYVAEDKEAYHVLGGNQANQVSITRVLKARLVRARTHVYISRPASALPFRLTSGGSVSLNER